MKICTFGLQIEIKSIFYQRKTSEDHMAAVSAAAAATAAAQKKLANGTTGKQIFLSALCCLS